MAGSAEMVDVKALVDETFREMAAELAEQAVGIRRIGIRAFAMGEAGMATYAFGAAAALESVAKGFER